jgi:hypothetical protein
MKCNLLRALLCALFLGAVLASPARANGDKGAIFPTTLDGSGLKGRSFDSKCAVYLAAGNGPHTRGKARGLPRGEYYFQVTDPSGKQLLSTDPVENRRFKVVQGVIVSHSGTHPTGSDHKNWKVKAITIGLAGPNCPADYLDTPSKRGAYKVWITPVDEFRANPARCRNRCFHGFVASESKTAVFRVRPAAPPPPTPGACLTIRKDLAPTEGAPFVPAEGWEMTVSDPLGTDNVFDTDENGEVQVCDLVDGSYVVSEERRPNTRVVGLIVNDQELLPESVYSFTWDSTRDSMSIVFQNEAFLPEN